MIEQYNKEMSEVHAPTDLILKTKAAMKAEEEKIKEEKLQEEKKTDNKTVVVKKSPQIWLKRIGLPLTAAAAVLLLVVVPNGLQTKDDKPDVKLPEQIVDKNIDGSKFFEDEVSIRQIEELPQNLENMKEVQIGENVWLVSFDETDEMWFAYIEKEGKVYMVKGSLSQEEDFLQKAEELLKEQY